MSISTFDDALAQYLGNLSYEREGSVLKAQLFVEACGAMLLLFPASQRTMNGEVRSDPTRWTHEMERARRWIANNPSSSASAGAIRFPDFSEFRG